MSSYSKFFLYLVFLLVLAELGCRWYFLNHQDKFTFFDSSVFLPAEDVLEQASQVFDKDLGWKHRFETEFGERPRTVDYQRPLIATFGDSYTHGDEVGDEETYQAYLSTLLQADVYNFGVSGYGPDQAMLRFEQDFPKAKTPVVVLGFIAENIKRIVNVYRPFYFEETRMPLSKPRFVLDAEKLRLLANPIRSKDELGKLQDPSFLHELGRNDYWFNRYKFPVLKFPYIGILFNQRLWLQVQYGRQKAFSHIPSIDPLWKQDEPKKLLFAILAAFVESARLQDATPVLVLMPEVPRLRGYIAGQNIMEAELFMSFCREQKYYCYDGYTALDSKRGENENLQELISGVHLSPQGNELFARGFYLFLLEQSLLSNPVV